MPSGLGAHLRGGTALGNPPPRLRLGVETLELEVFARVLGPGAIHAPSAPVKPSLAEVFGILPLKLSSFNPRPEGNWGVGLGKGALKL